MANVKHYLEQIKLEGELKELLIKGENVEVTLNGEPAKLADVIGTLPTTTAMNAAIASAISASGHAHFEKVTAVPAVEDAQENVLYLVMNADTNHYDIYAKIAGDTEGSFTMELLDDTTVDLTGKIDKVVGATTGKLPTFGTDGGLTDSGKKLGGEALSATPDANTLATEKAVSDAIKNQPVATTTAKGLMSAEDKTRLDTAGAVWVGETAPAEMRNGDLFIHVVASTESA